MSGPAWVDLDGGILGMAFEGADQKPVYLLKEVFEFKTGKHANLGANWDALVETITKADAVYASNRMPKERRIYVKAFKELVREDGRKAPGCLMVVVDRVSDRVMTAFIPDSMVGKLGGRLWP